METRVISVGTPLPPETFLAQVINVYDRAINMQISGRDAVTALLMDGLIDQPGDYRVREREPFFKNWIHVGQKVISRDGRIQFDGSPLAIRTDGAQVVDCRLPALTFPDTAAMKQAAGLLRQVHEETAAVKYGAGQVEKRIQNRLAESTALLTAALSARDAGLISTAVRQLVGLGIGLTPSGDDVLVGFTAGLAVHHQSETGEDEFLEQVKREIIVFSDKTNAVSRKYLRYAVKGYFSTPILRLLEAISAVSAPEDIRQRALNLTRMGHTSGLDTLFGLTAAINALQI